MTSIHWPSFWLGLLAPTMLTLAVLIVGGILTDLLNWLAPQEWP